MSINYLRVVIEAEIVVEADEVEVCVVGFRRCFMYLVSRYFKLKHPPYISFPGRY